MTIKHITKLSLAIATVILSNQAMAKGAISENSGFYGGVGFGGLIGRGGDFTYNQSELLAGATLGYEDMGWAFEVKGATSLGLDTSSGGDVDTISSAALAYRSLEKNGRYFKIKAGQQSASDDLSDETVIGLGIGYRTARDTRVEIEYEYTSYSFSNPILTSTTLDFPIHMISMNYLFGGASYDSRNFESETSLYAGVFLGMHDADANEYDNALAYGVVVGYEIAKGFSTEFQFMLTQAASSIEDDPTDSVVDGDEYETSSYGVFLVYKTPGTFYLKGRVGYQDVYESDELIVDGVTTGIDIINESGASYGIGAGYKMKNGTRMEVDYTVTDIESGGVSWTPSQLTFSYIF